MTERPNPVPWLERLLEVNAASDFTGDQKVAIAAALRKLLKEFGVEVATTR